MAAVNTDILIRSVLLLLAFSSFLFMGADYGDATLAANQVLIQFVYVTSYGMDGFAFAAEALVGKAMGSRAQAALRRAAILTSLWGLGVCALMAVLLALAGGVFIDAMTTAEGVRAEARTYLPWIVAAVLAGWASWMLDGIFIGATRTRDMRNMMALSFAGYVALVAVLAPAYGNHGLWAALAGFFALRGVTLAVRYPALERAAGWAGALPSSRPLGRASRDILETEKRALWRSKCRSQVQSPTPLPVRSDRFVTPSACARASRSRAIRPASVSPP